MPVVIKPEQFLKNKKSLSFEGFFVDNNIIISFQDPFGRSSLQPLFFEETQKSIHNLKAIGYKSVSIVSVALEYYKYIQYHSYTLYFQKYKFDPQDFKKKKNDDPIFSDTWAKQMKTFKKLFLKTFPLMNSFSVLNNISDFNFNQMDFGDHLLFKTLEDTSASFKVVFSNDKDFYSLPDDNFLITLNPEVLRIAKENKKLYEQIFK
jgi:hypothetical protein